MKCHQLTTLFFISLFFCCKSYGQGKRNMISASYGYSLPVGKFAKESAGDPLAGLAGSGYYGQINYDHRFANWIGFRISGSYNNNITNSEPIVDIANSYATLTGNTYDWHTDVSRWKMATALIGPAIYLHLGKLQIEMHGQGGIVKAQTPSVFMAGDPVDASGQPDPTGRRIEISLERRTVTPFGFAGGMSLRLPLFGGLYLIANGDVIGAKAEVKDLAFKAKVGDLEISDQVSEKRFIGVVNLGGGLGIAF